MKSETKSVVGCKPCLSLIPLGVRAVPLSPKRRAPDSLRSRAGVYTPSGEGLTTVLLFDIEKAGGSKLRPRGWN